MIHNPATTSSMSSRGTGEIQSSPTHRARTTRSPSTTKKDQHAAGRVERFRQGACPERLAVTLYRLEGCPYCELVVDELDDRGLAFDSVWVEGLHSKRNEVRRVSGQRQVPVLVDERSGATIAESARIVEYLETTHA